VMGMSCLGEPGAKRMAARSGCCLPLAF